ncbi:hypothetical protein CRV12_01495 [Candidatus Pantoea edessiphila]|uniref:DUF883 domain-containing protein n=1 Tax=Candidatus Pantoea edessiphila TaxID=2044610 RepID=A0A2P5T159_9GAMM|nr:DUF883 family protein [Candidatus Pantoea edessiphila]PPI88282.1 hypothetical protein CRV12_01495 [Candidatus Pantoea edessiphila]
MFNQTKEYNNINMNQNIKEMINSLRSLLKSYGNESKDEIIKARNYAEKILKKNRNKPINNDMYQETKNIINQIDTYIHEKPWYGVSIGTTLGLMLSILLFSRR